MADIVHDVFVRAAAGAIFRAVSTPAGLEAWWTKTASGRPAEGSEYRLGFGPGFDWRAVVTRCVPDTEFEIRMTGADADWKDTRIGFVLEPAEGSTRVRFHHTGWPAANTHYRVSCFCWAMYLRLLRRYIESGERVPYEQRLDA